MREICSRQAEYFPKKNFHCMKTRDKKAGKNHDVSFTTEVCNVRAA